MSGIALAAAAPNGRRQRTAQKNEKRFLTGLCLDTPEERDDPYRYFGW